MIIIGMHVYVVQLNMACMGHSQRGGLLCEDASAYLLLRCGFGQAGAELAACANTHPQPGRRQPTWWSCPRVLVLQGVCAGVGGHRLFRHLAVAPSR
jgi:hypothetical protein